LARGSHVPAPNALLSSALPVAGVADFWVFLLFIYLFCCLGFKLPLGETLVYRFVLVLLFYAVSDLDYFSVSTASVTFGWLLLLFPSGGTNKLALLCAPLTFLIALCGHSRGLSHLFNQFHTFCNYFSTVLVWFGFIVGEPTPFSFIGSSTSFFF